MNGSEPRRGFLLCLAAILESTPEMKSTLQSRIDRRSCHCRLMLWTRKEENRDIRSSASGLVVYLLSSGVRRHD
jgi:hypothetical protein